jgi:hypothetical protein
LKPFVDLIERQLAFFRADYADLIERCDEAERAYDRAPREEAEERYAEYLELVEEGVEALADIRDTYAQTLEPEQAETYEATFGRQVRRRLPQFPVDAP